jgi:hypothetical protein
LFTVLISNVDDHLRNHGFLYDSAQRGWRLSPAYDINPVPPNVKARYLSTLIDERDTEASFDLVLSTGEYDGLNAADIRRNKFATVNSAKDLRVFAPAANPVSPRRPFAGTLHSQNIARRWLERADGEKRAFFQVFRNPFHLA